jgi:hypothetical protein
MGITNYKNGKIDTVALFFFEFIVLEVPPSTRGKEGKKKEHVVGQI